MSRERSKPAITDERLAAIISFLLRAGVVGSSAVVVIGGLFYLIQHRSDSLAYAHFHLERSNLRNVPGIIRSSMRLRPDAIIQLGLVILIATPVARVVLAAIGFWLERDRLYVGVSLVVLAILCYSLMHAF